MTLHFTASSSSGASIYVQRFDDGGECKSHTARKDLGQTRGRSTSTLRARRTMRSNLPPCALVEIPVFRALESLVANPAEVHIGDELRCCKDQGRSKLRHSNAHVRISHSGGACHFWAALGPAKGGSLSIVRLAYSGSACSSRLPAFLGALSE